MKPIIRAGELNVNFFLLLLILAAAIFLRFFRFADIPFTQDEYSAIFRTDFSNVRDLIEYGVKPDGHPAGIQLLIFLIRKTFGLPDLALKIPFLVSGVLAVYLTFRIAAEWFNPTVGLISASFISVLQYTVYYSQIARPYASGLFLSLWMVWHWTAVLSHPERNLKKNLTGFILAGILCSYNHHFSLLFTAIVWVTGLFLVNPQRLRSYILSGIIMLLAYIPHLPVTFYQLGMKGVEEWLSRPDPSFIVDYIGYVFHFSPLFAGATLMLIVTGFFLKNNKPPGMPYRIIGITWFLIPLITGYVYSIFFNAVLQYSVLIFTFPFLLIFLFSFLKDLRPLYKTIAVAVVLTTGTATLFLKRHHYDLLYNSGPQRILKETGDRIKEYGLENMSIIYQADKRVIQYNLLSCQLLRQENIWHISDTTSIRTFRDYLKERDTDYLIFAWTALPKLELVNVISEYYPVHLEREDYFLSEFHLFAKHNEQEGVKDIKWIDRTGFEPGEELKGFHPGGITGETCYEGTCSYRIDPLEEYGPVYPVKLTGMDLKRNDYISVELFILIDDPEKDPVLVATVEWEGEGLEWRGLPVRQFLPASGEWGKASVTFQFPGHMLGKKDMVFKTYVWNRDKSLLFIDNFKVELYRGNSRLYGLFENI